MTTPRYEIVVSRRDLPDGTPEWAEYAEWRTRRAAIRETRRCTQQSPDFAWGYRDRRTLAVRIVHRPAVALYGQPAIPFWTAAAERTSCSKD